MKIYNDCDIHPSSTMHTLMETAEKTKKPEDAKNVASHYADLERVFKQQCGISNSLFKTRWSIGTNSGGPGAPTAAQRQELNNWQGGPR